MVALLPPQRAPVHLDADAVMACVKSTQVDHTISCTGRAKGRQHAPAPVATEQSRVFSEAVAVEIGMWGDDPVGVDQIPMELVLPHENGSATFGIAGVVAATSARTWRPSCQARANTARGTCTTGWCTEWCRMGRNPRRWSCSFIGVVVMRTLTWMVWSAAWASTTRTRSVRRKVRVRRGPQARTEAAARRARTGNAAGNARDKRGRRAFGSKRKRTRGTPNATGSDMDEEDGETSMVELLRLVANTWRKHTTVMRPRACLMTAGECRE
ncbi:hypothetical protein ERJ75_000923100 [Trypanosoma vivax]|nr:hypothetical protein ERJ75_000923100 [Trypanosoma vivax]